MPVVVVGAESAVGRAAVRQLIAGGGEVRVYLDADRGGQVAADGFRRLGAKTALGSLDDEGHLEMACEQVHTLVHLAGDVLSPPALLVDTLATSVSAALGAGCRRLVWASHLLAGEPRDSAWLQACAEGEQLIAEAPLETVVLRCALVYGPGEPLTSALAGGGQRLLDQLGPAGVAGARHRPLFIEHVAGAVVAADRQREQRGDLHLTLPLAGPDEVTLGEFVRRLSTGRNRRPLQPLPPWTWPVLARDAADPQGAMGISLSDGLAALQGGGSSL